MEATQANVPDTIPRGHAIAKGHAEAALRALTLTRGRKINIDGFIWEVVKSTTMPRRLTLKPIGVARRKR